MNRYYILGNKDDKPDEGQRGFDSLEDGKKLIDTFYSNPLFARASTDIGLKLVDVTTGEVVYNPKEKADGQS